MQCHVRVTDFKRDQVTTADTMLTNELEGENSGSKLIHHHLNLNPHCLLLRNRLKNSFTFVFVLFAAFIQRY